MNAPNQHKTTKRLFLARHGESLGNQQKLLSGQLDLPLTEKGQHQAFWLCDVLKHENLSAIYASSLSRAIQTAHPTATHHGIAIDALDDLKEIHLGVLQGRSPSHQDSEAMAIWQARENAKETFTVPGGEAYPAFKQRVLNCLAQLLPTLPGNALIVAHRNTNEVILSQLMGHAIAKNKVINIKNKYLYEIELSAGLSINTIRLGGESHSKKFTGFKDD